MTAARTLSAALESKGTRKHCAGTFQIVRHVVALAYTLALPIALGKEAGRAGPRAFPLVVLLSRRIKVSS